jgi:hypothetical protein
MSTRTAKKQKCLTCNKAALVRGLCACCRMAAQAAIGRGEVTEAELVRRGLMLEPKRTGRPPNSPFVKALRSKR